jgi:hypothetical protein
MPKQQLTCTILYSLIPISTYTTNWYRRGFCAENLKNYTTNPILLMQNPVEKKMPTAS